MAMDARYRIGRMLVAVALAAGCDEFISEDLHEGMVFDGRLRVSNPFA
jgi:predicted nucleic acid-binding protein